MQNESLKSILGPMCFVRWYSIILSSSNDICDRTNAMSLIWQDIPDPDNLPIGFSKVDLRIIEAINTIKLFPKDDVIFTYRPGNKKDYEWCMAAQKYVKSLFPKANVLVEEETHGQGI